MKAIILKQPGGAEQLQLSETEKPVPKTDELLIRVEAAAVNRTDIVNRKRKSGYMNHPILGVEVAGVVEKTVQGSGIAEGTRVMGLVNGGGYAQYAVMPMNRAMTIRSEEHTSELQSRGHLVCRLLLEKKKMNKDKDNRRR